MDKIYSRKRIPLNIKYTKMSPDKKIIIRKIYKIITILLIAVTVGARFEKFANPLYEQVCEEEVKALATLITNEQTTIVMSNYTYDDMFSIEKDAEGNITMVKSNISNINYIASDIAWKIQSELSNNKKNKVSIPLGAFTGIAILSGVGPDIKIDIETIGSIETEIKSEFISKGINQTLHRVYIEIVCPVSIVTPYRNVNEKIFNQVLLEENIIVGQIPEIYYNLEGITSEDTIKLMK